MIRLLSILSVLLNCISTLVVAENAACYYPDGSIAQTYEPCTSTDGETSWCCDLSSSVCTTMGYCGGSNGLMYRGGCTDSTWLSPSCPQYCKNVQNSTFSTFFNCADPGTYSQTWCCFDGSPDSCCSDSFLITFGTSFTPNATTTITVAAAAKTASSVASSSSTSTSLLTTSAAATATTAAPSHSASSSNSGTTIGVGVGVGVGVALLAIAGILFTVFSEKKKRVAAEKRLDEKLAELETRATAMPPRPDKHNYHESASREQYEIGAQNAPYKVESASRERYEI